jgi:hypothetical protein
MYALAEQEPAPVSDRYEEKLERRLASLGQAKPTARPMRRAAWIAAALTLLAATALAAQGLGFVDFIRHYDEGNGGDIQGLIQESIGQIGGETSLASFSVRAAAYDGRELQVVIGVTPKNPDDVALEEDTDKHALAALAAQGKRPIYATVLVASIGGVSPQGYTGNSGVRQEENALVCGIYTGCTLETQSPVEIVINCAVWEKGGEILRSELHFELPVIDPEQKKLTLEADLGVARVTGLELSHTPLGLHAVIDYTPVLTLNPAFVLVGPDGSWFDGETQTDWDKAAGTYSARCVWPTAPVLPPSITLWCYGSKTAAIIDTATGALEIKPVRIAYGEHDEILRIDVVQ